MNNNEQQLPYLEKEEIKNYIDGCEKTMVRYEVPQDDWDKHLLTGKAVAAYAKDLTMKSSN